MNGRRAFLIAGSGKPRRGHEKHCPAARIEATKKTSAHGRSRARDHPQGPRGSGSAPRLPSWGCAGTAGCPAASATPGGCPRGHVLPFEPASLPQKVTNAPISPNLDSSSKTGLETRGKNRELKRKLSKRALTQRKARAREEPSPGPPAATSPARGPGAPTAQPRPRGPDLESAQV